MWVLNFREYIYKNVSEAEKNTDADYCYDEDELDASIDENETESVSKEPLQTEENSQITASENKDAGNTAPNCLNVSWYL